MDAVEEEEEEEEEVEEEEESVPTQAHPLGPYTHREYTFAVCAGAVLAFNSGYVNGSCFSGFVAPSGRRQSAASFTGTLSRSALNLGDGQYDMFAFLIGMVLSFFAGACISGLLTPSPTPFRIEPTYGPTFLMGAACLTLASILAALEQHEDWVFFLAAAADGIQNGISSIYSSGLIRSTGYTGAITDICIFLAQIIIHKDHKNKWKLCVLLTLMTSFWVGSLVSFWSAQRFTSFSLLINAGIFVLIGGSLVAFLVYELGISFQQAILGSWKWQKAMDKLHDSFDHGAFSVNNHRQNVKKSITGFEDNSSSLLLNREGSNHQPTRTVMTDRHLSILFKRLDTDNSNSLDLGELLVALQNAGMEVTERECQVMMNHADTDGDGTISCEEWIDLARSCHSKKSRRSNLVSFR
ncbi:membrAne [Seminavis robusta]|uniref:MembrAne n=1 Tax=Seminavis robusta TaxID=568900 RepID=A0A9N8HMY1_9STRA|nr:membrAne [Seminavis robusta]|eukprot:Sro1037_g234130.1 membrAne (410) ;mRNA; r:14874-16103